MLSGPHMSSLFPYTTLFRSVHSQGLASRLCGSGWRKGEMHPFHEHVDRKEAIRGCWKTNHRGVIANPRRNPRMISRVAADPIKDRKSTRLNSSHVAISYAVF